MLLILSELRSNLTTAPHTEAAAAAAPSGQLWRKARLTVELTFFCLIAFYPFDVFL